MSQNTFEGGKVSCEPSYGGLYPSERDMGLPVITYAQLIETPKVDNTPLNRKQRRQEARKKK